MARGNKVQTKATGVVTNCSGFGAGGQAACWAACAARAATVAPPRTVPRAHSLSDIGARAAEAALSLVWRWTVAKYRRSKISIETMVVGAI